LFVALVNLLLAPPSSTTASMDFETHLQLKETEAALAKQHAEYLASHPEVNNLLNDFVSDFLLKKPSDVYAFAKSYFSTFAPVDAPSFTPVIITGPSGVGKGTLIERLMSEHPDCFGLSVSNTTRAPRPGEIPGFHYHFSVREDMEKGIANNEFLESALVHGNLYGTSKKAVENVIKLGKICILDIDVQGCESVKKSGIPCRYIFIAPPSEDELKRRLVGRGTETPESVERRLNNAKKELEYAHKPGFFNHVIVNIDLETAYAELKAIIQVDIKSRDAYLKGTK